MSEIQKILLKQLERDGIIENLGNSYRYYCKSPRQTSNTTILNFVKKVQKIYPTAVLIPGVRGGLGTATLKLN